MMSYSSKKAVKSKATANSKNEEVAADEELY